MSAEIHQFRTRAQREHVAHREQLRQLVLAFPELPDEPVREILKRLAENDAKEPGKWIFIMISPAQNNAVVKWLDKNSTRPRQATRLWSELFCVMRGDTGEILATRDELAERVDASPRNVSRIMGELESIGAIARKRERIPGQKGPGRVKYFMLPDIATTLPRALRNPAQATARHNAGTARPTEQLQLVK